MKHPETSHLEPWLSWKQNQNRPGPKAWFASNTLPHTQTHRHTDTHTHTVKEKRKLRVFQGKGSVFAEGRAMNKPGALWE